MAVNEHYNLLNESHPTRLLEPLSASSAPYQREPQAPAQLRMQTTKEIKLNEEEEEIRTKKSFFGDNLVLFKQLIQFR